MALPGSGPISLSQVNTELGRPATQMISLNDGGVRGLAGKASGSISMSDLRGKSSVTVGINGYFSQTSSGGDRYMDIGSFSISKTGGGAITSYSWSMNDYDGRLSFESGNTTANYSMRGPPYSPFNMTMQGTVEILCTVVIDGVSYTRSAIFNYQYPDGL